MFLSIHTYSWRCLCAALFFLSSNNSYASDFDDLREINPTITHQHSNIEAISLPTNTSSPAEGIEVTPHNQVHETKPSMMSKVAIIIDDIGYNHAQGMRAMALPGAITYAIIPHSPKAEFFALEAQKHEKEVMLHAPMSNVHNIPLGENGLSETMDETHFKQALKLSLDSLPDAKGVNNHMGSLLTQKALPMEWVMQALQERQLYFIDSRTTSNSVAWEIAQHFNIPSLKRDVFLDHKPTHEFIEKQFSYLISLAKEQGYAVAIAHPYPETIAFLEQHLSSLSEHKISLVSASELVSGYSPNKMAQKNTKSVTKLTKMLLE